MIRDPDTPVVGEKAIPDDPAIKAIRTVTERSFETARKWRGPNQHTGVVNRCELLDIGGEPVVEELLRHVARPR